ncbi:MAG TPA: hypothetical protein V6D35_18805 [Candidatus Sericytochromatia bacterium]|jgi:hypothetical protein
MNASTFLNTPSLKKKRPWYEAADGSCAVEKPMLIDMGDDKPLHLLFPIECSKSLLILPEAQNLASKLDALLVLMLYGEVSLEEMQSLVLHFATESTLFLWIGEKNWKMFNDTLERFLN